MKRYIFVLLLALAVVFSSVAAASAADSILLTPQVPVYQGGDGTGQWVGNILYNHSPDGRYAVEIQITDFLYLDSVGYLNDQSKYEDQTFYSGQSGQYLPTFNPIHTNTPSSCAYPGFHWFAQIAIYRWRTKATATAQWGTWSPQQWTPPGPGVYGQACL